MLEIFNGRIPTAEANSQDQPLTSSTLSLYTLLYNPIQNIIAARDTIIANAFRINSLMGNPLSSTTSTTPAPEERSDMFNLLQN
ncbi:MAG: hypothetical protein B6U86_05120 [Candidatus Altiarchaeales archaeon ex4484_43]|nr:MAG: hypothetical protein B6U86_05120 [Candidatus Altiarchaeales archaeon ex4484_43]